ncbi:MAG: TetR family transcriptional regulator [Bryobacteraceae bacterium]
MRNRTDVKSTAKSEETRQKIFSAALALFLDGGFETTTMRDIAAKAGVATGAAYYYFASKDAFVLAFYEKSALEMAPLLEEALASSSDLRKRLAAILDVKLAYFAASRRLLKALAAHVDPEHPLSPFSEATKAIRDQDIACFALAVSGSKTRVAADMDSALPRLLWMYQMGVILYWIHDRSADQERTRALIDKSLGIIVRLIQLSSLPLMSPVRRQALELYRLVAE